MKALVIDTNVLVVANGGAQTHAKIPCQENCLNLLTSVRKRSLKIVLDCQGYILKEYQENRSPSKQGIGDKFIVWLFNNQYYDSICERVDLPDADSVFPQDPDLSNFDASDKKFVAVAIRSVNHPEIVNATDSDWTFYADALSNHGIKVKNICPEELKKT